MTVLGLTINLTQVIGAVVAALPAIIAAYHARKSQRNTDTSNGTNLGVMVEELRGEFSTFKTWVEGQLKTPSGDELGKVAERTHDLAAVNAAAIVKEKGRQ